jgi:hypothetical protein
MNMYHHYLIAMNRVASLLGLLLLLMGRLKSSLLPQPKLLVLLGLLNPLGGILPPL